MRGPYGFEIIDNCQTCTAKKSAFFCQMSPKATKEFNSIKSGSAYPGGATLFLEKQDSRGVFVLCEGEVKLTISSSEGKTLILRIAKAGEVLGLMAASPGNRTRLPLRPCIPVRSRTSGAMIFCASSPSIPRFLRRSSCSWARATTEPASNCEPSAFPSPPREGFLKAKASGYVRRSRGDQTWNKNPDAFDPRGDRGVYRQFARDRYTRPGSEFRSMNLVTLKGSSLLDLKQGWPGTVCNGLSWHAALRFRPLAPALRPVFSQDSPGYV